MENYDISEKINFYKPEQIKKLQNLLKNLETYDYKLNSEEITFNYRNSGFKANADLLPKVNFFFNTKKF